MKSVVVALVREGWWPTIEFSVYIGVFLAIDGPACHGAARHIPIQLIFSMRLTTRTCAGDLPRLLQALSITKNSRRLVFPFHSTLGRSTWASGGGLVILRLRAPARMIERWPVARASHTTDRIELASPWKSSFGFVESTTLPGVPR